MQQQLVSQRLTEQIPAILEALQSLRTTDVLQQPYQVGKATLGELLDVAQLDKSKQETFAKALVNNTQSMRNFWRTLGDGKHGFTPEEASAVQRTLEVGAFVKNHLPLVQVLLQSFTTGTYTSLANLARLSVQDWEQLVNQVGAPPNIDAAGTASPAEVFARVIYAQVTRAYPTTALSGRITRATSSPSTSARRSTSSSRTMPHLSSARSTFRSTWSSRETRRNTSHLRTSHGKLRGERIKQLDKIKKLILRIKGLRWRHLTLLGFILVVDLLDLPTIDAQATCGQDVLCHLVLQARRATARLPPLAQG